MITVIETKRSGRKIGSVNKINTNDWLFFHGYSLIYGNIFYKTFKNIKKLDEKYIKFLIEDYKKDLNSKNLKYFKKYDIDVYLMPFESFELNYVTNRKKIYLFSLNNQDLLLQINAQLIKDKNLLYSELLFHDEKEILDRIRKAKYDSENYHNEPKIPLIIKNKNSLFHFLEKEKTDIIPSKVYYFHDFFEFFLKEKNVKKTKVRIPYQNINGFIYTSNDQANNLIVGRVFNYEKRYFILTEKFVYEFNPDGFIENDKFKIFIK